MLSPQDLELLTAHVDGELTRRQRREVARLLECSEEARELLRRLQADALLVRRLPPLQAPADCATAILDQLARGKRLPFRRRRPPAEPAHHSSWLVLVAAAVLLLIGTVSFLLHSREDAPEPGRLAQADKTKQKTPRRDLRIREAEEAVAAEKDVSQDRPSARAPVAKDKGAPEPPPAIPDRLHPPAMTPEDDGNRTVLTSPRNDPAGRFEQVDLSLPTLWKLHELDQGDVAARLLGQLRAAGGFRVELLARDATRGFERLRAALQERRVQLLYDPAVPPRLKKPLWKTDYAVFAENVPPEVLLEALKAAGKADRQTAAKRPGEMRFDGPVVVKELAALDRKELTALLGIDPVANRPARAVRRSVDIRRPLPDQTAAQIADGLDGRGTPRPGAAPEMSGYVTLLSGNRSKPAELRRFLDGRRPEHPGTIQVFLVVRQVGG